MHDDMAQWRGVMPGCCLPIRPIADLTAPGRVQMAIDEALLGEAEELVVRRYFWEPPAVSLGRAQRWQPSEDLEGASWDLPFDVVRRPSGGRAVLHGVDFEWSFAVVFPQRRQIDDTYRTVSRAMAGALRSTGVSLADAREEPYRRSALCFATSLRYDLHVGTAKAVAVAQIGRGESTLVHGSVLERRPPEHLIGAVEDVLGETWRGDGLQGQEGIDRDVVWSAFIDSLGEQLQDVGGATRSAIRL